MQETWGTTDYFIYPTTVLLRLIDVTKKRKLRKEKEKNTKEKKNRNRNSWNPIDKTWKLVCLCVRACTCVRMYVLLIIRKYNIETLTKRNERASFLGKAKRKKEEKRNEKEKKRYCDALLGAKSSNAMFFFQFVFIFFSHPHNLANVSNKLQCNTMATQHLRV